MKLKLGELPQPEDKRDYKLSESAGYIKEVNLKDYVYFIRDQKYNDCVFNSIASQIEIEYILTYGKKIKVKDVLGVSVGEAYSKGRILDRTFPHNYGYIPREAYKMFKNYGAVPEYFMPYKTYKLDMKPTTIHEFFDGFIKIKRFEFVSIDEIPYVLSRNKPVRIGVNVDSAFIGLKRGVLYEHSGINHGGHSVLIIGQKFDSDGNIIYKILNSWGTLWGFYGVGWVSQKWLKQQQVSEGNIIYV